MSRAEWIPLSARPLRAPWKVYKDPLTQQHSLPGAVFYGKQSLQMNDHVSGPKQIHPLESVATPTSPACPTCGSRESIDALESEVDRLSTVKALMDRAKREKPATKPATKQLHLFGNQRLDAGFVDGSGTINNGGGTKIHMSQIDTTAITCADCATVFDPARIGDVSAMRQRLRALRIETESAVDTLGRVGQG